MGPPDFHSAPRWWIGLASAGAFIGLALCVRAGLTQSFDSAVREWARPHDIWGRAQLQADLVVQALRPAVLAALLAVLTAARSVKRRSFRPAVLVGLVGLATVALTVATKTAVDRLDPHGLLTNHGGSFPSGHIICVVLCVGLAGLLARPRPAWWIWLIAALGGDLMGAALLLQATHWFTDIVGGGLLATLVLVVVASSGWNWWSHGGSGIGQGAASNEVIKITQPSAPRTDEE